jgi:hypothetical protein
LAHTPQTRGEPTYRNVGQRQRERSDGTGKSGEQSECQSAGQHIAAKTGTDRVAEIEGTDVQRG